MPDVQLASDHPLAPDPQLAADLPLAAVPDGDHEYRRRMLRELILRALL
jgi:hypothetical protein